MAYTQFIQNTQLFLRKFLPCAFIPLAYSLVAPFFINKIDDEIIKGLFHSYGALFIWIIFVICLFYSFKAFKFKNKEDIRKAIDKENMAFTPLASEDDVLISGDKELWQYHKEQVNSAKIKGLPLIINNFDWAFLGSFLIMLVFFGFSFKTSKNALAPEIIEFFGIKKPQISAFIIKDNQNNLPLILDKKATLDEGQKILIEISGAKSAPLIKMGSFKSYAFLDKNKNYALALNIKKSGVITINYYGVRQKYFIHIIKDKKPEFLSDISVLPTGTDRTLVQFSAKDDHEITEAQLVFEGFANNGYGNNHIISTFPIAKKDIKNNGQTISYIETQESPLIGQNVLAWVELRDKMGHVTRSKKISYNLPNISLSSQISQALQEIRLLIIIETKKYKKIKNSIYNVPFGEAGVPVNIDITNNIDFAPQSIKRAYGLLEIFANSQNLGFEDDDISTLKYALQILQSARNTNETYSVGNILWPLIQKYNKNNQSTKDMVSDAIESLKQAIKDGASEGKIANLQEKLKEAIQNHIDNLSSQSGEAGDMDVEDNSNFNTDDINKMLSDIEKNPNKDDAISKLDELNNLMQNLQMSNGGGSGFGSDNMGNKPANGNQKQGQGEGQGGALSSLIDKQRNLNEKTKDSKSDNAQLSKEQSQIAKELEDGAKAGGQDASNILEAMKGAARSLEKGDKESAKAYQKRALDNLINKADQGMNKNTDPLGRPLDEKNNGNAPAFGQGNKNYVPDKNGENKTRNIIQILRDKLSRPNDDKEEEKYYHNLLENNK